MRDKNIQQIYFRRAKAVALLLQLAPFVRMVALNGSLSRNEANEGSDIDFFVFLKKDRLWLGRLLVTLAVALTGLRRTDKKIAGRICLNRYQTEDNLLISPQTKENAKHHSYMIIFWGDNKKLKNANFWMKRFDYQIKLQQPVLNGWRILTRPFQFVGEFLIDLMLGDWGETKAQKYQVKRIQSDPRTKASRPGSIYFSGSELRFHPTKNLDIDR